MDRRHRYAAGLVAALGGLFGNQPSQGQVIIDGGTAAENVRTAGTRAPGLMVGAGVARAVERITPLSPTEITETAEPTDALDEARREFQLEAVAELNEFLVFFLNQLLQRRGFPPFVPEPPAPPDDGANGDGTNGDTTNGDTTNGDTTDGNGDGPRPGDSRDPRGKR